jgi:hypothetical protein
MERPIGMNDGARVTNTLGIAMERETFVAAIAHTVVPRDAVDGGDERRDAGGYLSTDTIGSHSGNRLDPDGRGVHDANKKSAKPS